MSSSEFAIRAEGVSKNYARSNVRSLKSLFSSNDSEELWALDNVSFELKKGEILGVIGRNGSGKSTLLRILSGITKPTSGRIEIEGSVASILDIGSGFHPELSGRENVYLRGELLGMRRKDISDVFDAIVDFSGVERFIDSPVKHYSDGMFLRLAFSVLTHLNADILLFDEVLSVGDQEFQEKCRNKLYEIVNNNCTIIHVSHNASEVLSFSTKLMLLDYGKKLDFGDPVKILGKYKSILGITQHNVYQASMSKNTFNNLPVNEFISFKEVTGSAQDDVLHVQGAFEILTNDSKIDLVFVIKDVGDTRLFATHTLASEDTIRKGTGTYQFNWPVDTSILNFGSYEVELLLIVNSSIHSRYSSLFSFEVPGQLEERVGFQLELPIRTSSQVEVRKL